MRTRVKICCILNEDEAALAVRLGADAVGLVGPGLSGPEVRDEATIARIAATIPPFVASVLLTRVSEPEALADQVARCGARVVQICDAVSPQAYAAVRARCPGVAIAQVVHVADETAIAQAQALDGRVDAILLDSGTPHASTPVYGGTGATHDWSISARVVRAVRTPVILAGGLRAHNVREAIRTVQPWALDLCSGIRTEGRLDEAEARAFLDAVAAESRD